MTCSSVPSPSRSRAKQSFPVLRTKITRPATVTRSPLPSSGSRLGVLARGCPRTVPCAEAGRVRVQAGVEQLRALVQPDLHLLGKVVLTAGGRLVHGATLVRQPEPASRRPTC